MHPTLRIDDPAHLARLERECRVLERLLHLPAREPAEVATFSMRAAIRVFLCKRREFRRIPCNFGLILLEERYGFVFGARDVRLGAEGSIRCMTLSISMPYQYRLGAMPPTSFQLDALLLSRCLTSKWLAHTLVSPPPASSVTSLRYSAPGRASISLGESPGGADQSD